MSIKRILVMVLSLMVVFSGAVFASGDFSDVVEVTSSVFSVPDETVKSAFGECEVLGNTDTSMSNSVKSTNNVVVKSVGKNLLPAFEKWTLQSGISVIANNKIQQVESVIYGNAATSPFVPVKSNVLYVFSQTATSTPTQYLYQIQLREYDEDKTLIKTNYLATQLYITTQSNTKYVTIQLNSSHSVSGTNIFENPQLEYGTTSTSYAKYETSEVFLNSELNSIQDNNENIVTRDKVDFNSGIYTKNTEKIVLDGNEDWIYITHTSYGNGKETYVFKIEDFVSEYNAEEFGNSNEANVSCNKKIKIIPYWDGADWSTEGEVMAIDNDNSQANNLVLKILDTEGITNVTELQTYLSQNPITLIYQLAQPQTTQLLPQNLIAYPNGTIIVETEDDSTLPTIKYSVQIDSGDQLDNHEEQINGLFDMVNNNSKAINKLNTRQNAGPFKIACTPDTPFSLVLTASNANDFGSRKFTVIYDEDELEVTDLCASTATFETGTSPLIDGTNIAVIKDDPGIIEFIIYNPVEESKNWSGAVNTIIFTPKDEITEATVTYVVE